MNPQMNPPNPGALSVDAPVKRKRGRPRKDETHAQALDKSTLLFNRPLLRPVLTRTQGELSATPSPTTPTLFKGKDHIEGVDQGGTNVSNDDHNNKDEMVGQVVTGVLECAFDAGYFLTVRIGETDVLMRGVVFKEASVVPVTPDNDIAPNAMMYKRKEVPIPVGNSSSKPTENIENPQTVQNVILLQGQSSVIASEEQTAQNPQIVCNSSGQNATEEPRFKMGFASFGQIVGGAENQQSAQNPQIVCNSSSGQNATEEPRFKMGFASFGQIVSGVENQQSAQNPQIVCNSSSGQNVTEEPRFKMGLAPFDLGGVENQQSAQNPQIVCNSSTHNATEEPQFKMGLASFGQIIGAVEKEKIAVREEKPSEVIIEPYCESKEMKKNDSPINERLEESFSEPPLKVQKISEHDDSMSYLNADQSCESAVIKSTTDGIETAVLPMELLIQPETAFANNTPGVMSPVLDPEMGGAAGFQISMENTDNDEPLSENPSPKEAEYKQESEK